MALPQKETGAAESPYILRVLKLWKDASMSMTSNQLSAELLQAFADTHYIVHHEAPFVMHIGKPCPELKTLMVDHNALGAAFITAWNPFSQNLPAKENQARQDELKANLKRRGLICIDGIGKHPSNNWPGEVSVLVLGLDLEAAKSLARHYEQHAFVWAAGDGVPELIQP
jgi:hypothetical protein